MDRAPVRIYSVSYIFNTLDIGPSWSSSPFILVYSYMKSLLGQHGSKARQTFTSLDALFSFANGDHS